MTTSAPSFARAGFSLIVSIDITIAEFWTVDGARAGRYRIDDLRVVKTAHASEIPPCSVMSDAAHARCQESTRRPQD